MVLLDKKSTLVVFGYGPQGRAQALNLRDSGWNPFIYLRPQSQHLTQAQKDGFTILTDPILASQKAKIAFILIDDFAHENFYHEFLHKHLPHGAILVFSHGFSVHFKKIVPRADCDVILVAPKGPAKTLREHYKIKPFLFAIGVAQDASQQAFSYAKQLAFDLGATEESLIHTDFKEETITDIYSEQVTLCGVVPAILESATQNLIEAGYNPQMAWHECVRELEFILKLIQEEGFEGMRQRISQMAKVGGQLRAQEVMTAEFKQQLKDILVDIESGAFLEKISQLKK